jgi:hypothetical protein
VAQVVEYLPSQFQALSSNPSTTGWGRGGNMQMRGSWICAPCAFRTCSSTVLHVLLLFDGGIVAVHAGF